MRVQRNRPCAGCGNIGKGRLCLLCVVRRGRLRARAAICLRMEGLTFQEIGDALNVGREQASHMVLRGDRDFSEITVYGKKLDYIQRKSLVGERKGKSFDFNPGDLKSASLPVLRTT